MVIAPIVIDEIDKHKRNSKKKIATRARSITKLFEQIMDKEDPDWILIDKRPTSATFSENSLEKSEQDDCLLAAILEFSPENIDDQKILISEDFGPRLKAKNLNIKTIKLSDSELLAEEPDELEIRLQKLVRENNELKNRVPKVDLFLGDKSKYVNFPEFQGTVTFDQYCARKMQELKKKHTYHKIPFKMPTQRDLIFQSNLMESMMYTESKRYNEDLDCFFEDYQHEYLPLVHNWHIRRLLSIEIQLEIYNEGHVPAENIDLRLRFPEGINIELADTFNPLPLSPVPPEKPLPFNELIMKVNKLQNELSSHVPSTPSLSKPWISIQKVNGLHVDMKCNYLKHHQSYKFSKLALSFQTLDDMKGFEFEYELMIANAPKLSNGKLQVNFVPTSTKTAVPFSKSLDKFLDYPHNLQ